jgi:hypothetical protein
MSFKKTSKCCSFCKEQGHNIKTCNDDRLLDFEYQCSIAVQDMTYHNELIIWINETYSDDKRMLKSYAVKKCSKITTRSNIDDCINEISQYIFKAYKPEEEDLLLEFANELVTPQVRMPQFEIQDNIGIERIIMREMIAYMMLRNTLNIEEQPKEVVKSNINLSLNNDENIDINKLCECSICLNDKIVKDFIELECEHQVCKDCIVKIIQMKRDNPTCPYCRAEITGLKCKTNGVKNELTQFVA